jgi:hypothetical protein
MKDSLYFNFSKLQEAITRIFSGVGLLLPTYMKAMVMNVDEVIKNKHAQEHR